MSWKKFFLNRYTIFYILYLYYLIGGSLPGQYAIMPVPYYFPETFIAKTLIGLFYILSIYFFVLLIWDILRKKYRIAIVNIFVAGILFVSYQLIARKALKPLYEKQKMEQRK